MEITWGAAKEGSAARTIAYVGGPSAHPKSAAGAHPTTGATVARGLPKEPL